MCVCRPSAEFHRAQVIPAAHPAQREQQHLLVSSAHRSHSHFADHVFDLVQRQLVQRELPQPVHGASSGRMQTEQLPAGPPSARAVWSGLCSTEQLGNSVPRACLYPPPSTV